MEAPRANRGLRRSANFGPFRQPKSAPWTRKNERGMQFSVSLLGNLLKPAKEIRTSFERVRKKRSSKPAEECCDLANDLRIHAFPKFSGTRESVRKGVHDESGVLEAAASYQVGSVA